MAFRITDIGPSFSQPEKLPTEENPLSGPGHQQVCLQITDDTGVLFDTAKFVLIRRYWSRTLYREKAEQFSLGSGTHGGIANELARMGVEKRLTSNLLVNHGEMLRDLLTAAPEARKAGPENDKADQWLYKGVTLVMFEIPPAPTPEENPFGVSGVSFVTL